MLLRAFNKGGQYLEDNKLDKFVCNCSQMGIYCLWTKSNNKDSASDA